MRRELMNALHCKGARIPRIAYVVQQFPALRTTFIRREIENLQKAGIELRVYSIRRPREAELRLETEMRRYLACTAYLPGSPITFGSIWANVRALVGHPRVMIAHWRSALLGSKSGKSLRNRGRVLLQIWRGPILAAQLRRDGGYGHVHVQFTDGACTTAMVACDLLGLGFSIRSHTSYDSDLLREKLSKALFVASISRFDVTRLSRCAPDVREKCHVIRCGLPLSEWPQRTYRPVSSPAHIISVGALIEKKGHDVLIASCVELVRRGLEFTCTIVGAGHQRGDLQKAITAARLSQRVNLVGPLPQNAIKEVLKTSDVFVLASKATGHGDTDGIPVSLMEAMATGVPVVSTSIAGIPEMIEHQRSGYLARVGDTTSLADCIEKALINGASREQLIFEARNRIELEYDGEKEVGLLADLLRRASVQVH